MSLRPRSGPSWSRRSLLITLGAAGFAGACQPGSPVDEEVPEAAFNDPVIDIEDATGGRIGVAAMNLATGERFVHRADERHAMCSTFKWILAGLVLRRVDTGEEQLDRTIGFTDADLVAWSPVTEAHAGTGLSVENLCAGAVSHSDNTAANLLLATLGGPSGFTAQLRELDDHVTRLDRWEPELNENVEGEAWDTTTPAAMLELMHRFLFEDLLLPASRERLRGWMIGSATGLDRLRAGLPRDWIAGDKTGTSANDQTNDVAFAIDPSGKTGPLLIVSFLNVPEPQAAERNFAHAAIARELVNRLV